MTWQRLVPTIATISIRIARGHFTGRDALVAAGVIGAYGPIEWTVHRHLLHGVAIGRLRVPAESAAVISHRVHHEAPDDLDRLFEPVRALPTVVATGATLAVLGSVRRPEALTAAATFLTLVSAYHWGHYLIHAPYRPRSGWFAKARENHLRHHAGGEDAWRMGVLARAVDEAIGFGRSEVAVHGSRPG